MTPDSATALKKLGHECVIEAGAGLRAGFLDEAYAAAGVEVVADAKALFAAADVIAKVRPPSDAEVAMLRPDQTLISFFYPSSNEELMKKAADTGATVIAMDMVPRISRAQKMDALSSMANIAGYRAVIEAGNNFGRFFTGQVTAAGKVPPAKVLIVGAGVAGLAAIGTSTSLGAITYAFDVRPEVAEQIESMGAEFVYLDFTEAQTDGAATGGYAAPSSPEFREAQLKKFRELAPDIDIVITTALIPNRPAPVLWTKDMVELMKPGSVIIDLAAERGGNCELTKPDEKIVSDNGVTIVGYTDFPSRMATQSSTLYATNIRHMMTDLTPEKDGQIVHNMEDDVIRGATVTYQGDITFPPPPPKVAAIAAQPKKEAPKELTPEEKKAQEAAAFKQQTKTQVTLLVIGAALLLGVGLVAPASFMQHFIVFVLAVFVAILLPIDLAEQLRAIGASDAGLGAALQLALLNLPSSLYRMLPLFVILATLVLFLSLARTSELVVVRASGRSALKSAMSPVIVALLIGILGLLVVNPLVAATERQYEISISRYQTGENRTLSVSGEGLWLRQGSQFGQTVIRAARANSDGTSLFGASFFVFDADGQIQTRIGSIHEQLGHAEQAVAELHDDEVDAGLRDGGDAALGDGRAPRRLVGGVAPSRACQQPPEHGMT